MIVLTFHREDASLMDNLSAMDVYVTHLDLLTPSLFTVVLKSGQEIRASRVIPGCGDRTIDVLLADIAGWPSELANDEVELDIWLRTCAVDKVDYIKVQIH